MIATTKLAPPFLAALLLAALLRPGTGQACTTILVGKGLTLDGSVLHAHNEDMGFEAVGRLWAVPGASHAGGSSLRVPYVELAQVPETLGYWAAGNVEGVAGLGTSEEVRPYDSVLVGLNERGVSMSCNWAHSRDPAEEGVGLRRYALRQLLLERATSARHGVELLGGWIETHGQADWGGLIYHLADPREAWVVETTAHHWVARRVRDNEIWVTANRFRIGADHDLRSEGLIEHAVSKGWIGSADAPLHFARVYGKEGLMDQVYDTRREERALDLLRDQRGALTPEDLFVVLRDRYEGTDAHTLPQAIEVWRENLEKESSIPRTISTNLAQSTSVAHLRGDRPVEHGAVLWLGLGVPNYTGYVPLYAGATGGGERFGRTAEAWGDGSVWKSNRQTREVADPNFAHHQPTVRAFWSAEQALVLERQRRFEAALSSPERADRLESRLEAFSWSELGRALEQGRWLLQHLEGSVRRMEP